MANADISEGARELVDVTAEALDGMGMHLAQIADIIAQSTMPPKKGERGAARRVRDKLELYKAYCADIARRKGEISHKMEEDFVRLKEWRKEAGTEGASMIEELEILFNKVRAQEKMLSHERQKVANERQKIRELVVLGEKKDKRQAVLAEAFVQKIHASKAEMKMRAGVCSWVQCSFDNIRFRFKSAEEASKLKIQYHQKMRKARAQARLECINRERERRLLQACVLAMQEETVEGRHQRHLEELRRRYEDHVLIMNAQIAQALGDEEKAKELINEQVRRLEEARAQARESERQMKLAQRDARDSKADAAKARQEAADARQAQAVAERRADVAEADARDARAEAADANARADASDEARIKAQQEQRKAEDEVRKKAKKVQSLQRMLAEIGAESDSDAPPDERPPAFFVNEDGSKAPRPRTRKERMGMAYREAESARWELRLGMAAMIDKDATSAMHIDRLRHEVEFSQREVSEVRRANEVLHVDLEEAVAAAEAAKQQARVAFATSMEAEALAAGGRPPPQVHAPQSELPLAPSAAAAPAFSPISPVFAPAPLLDLPNSSPRLLLKTASQPVFMPALYVGGGSPSRGQVPDKLTLAPLRKLKRPPNDWRVNWH